MSSAVSLLDSHVQFSAYSEGLSVQQLLGDRIRYIMHKMIYIVFAGFILCSPKAVNNR
jgi:hypothetical protein